MRLPGVRPRATAGRRRDRAFEALVREVSDPLFRTALLLSGDWQHAEDLVQTALTNLYVRGGWSRLDDPLGYLRRVALNAFISTRRRRSSQELPVEEIGERAYGMWRSPDSELRVDLFRALETLIALDRAIVVLRYWDDLSVAETAELVGLSPGAVRARSLRVLARLRRTLTTLYAYDTPGERP